MSAISPSSNILPSINTTQSGSAYVANIDGNCIAGLRLWGAFAPRAQSTPNMTMLVDPGHVFNGATLTELGAYTNGNTSASSGTISNVPKAAFAGLAVGMVVQAWYYASGVFTPLYPVGTIVTAFSQSAQTVTVSANASSSQTGAILIFAQPVGTIVTGNANGTTTLSGLQSTAGIYPGMAVSGTGVSGGASVASVDSATQVHVSANVTTGTGVSFTFSVPTQATNPRIDRVCINASTGVPTWVQGTAGSNPSPPSIPAGYVPGYQLLIGTSTTAITMTSVVADERDLAQLGAPGGTVTSVGIADATKGGIAVSGSPVTGAGTMTLALNPSDLLTKSTPTTSDSLLIMDAGASNAPKTATLAAVAVAIAPSGPFSAKFTSSPQAFPATGGTLTVAHGLGARPFNYQLFFQCTTANNGWSVGDLVQLQDFPVFGPMWADATNVYFLWTGSVSSNWYNKSTAASVNLTMADWEIVIAAWL